MIPPLKRQEYVLWICRGPLQGPDHTHQYILKQNPDKRVERKAVAVDLQKNRRVLQIGPLLQKIRDLFSLARMEAGH